jgi:lysophospholipase L1-like esterase
MEEGSGCLKVLVRFHVVLWAVLLFAAFAEFSSRWFLWQVADEGTFYEYASIEQKFEHALHQNEYMDLHPLLGWAPREGTYPWMEGTIRFNSRGFRGPEVVMPKPAEEFRIACLGGSTTLDEDVPVEEDTYPARLEAELRQRGYNVTVINAGSSNHASNQTLITYAFRVSYCEPDMIVLYEGINDWLRRLEWPPENYTSDSSAGSGMRDLIDGKASFTETLGRSTFLRLLLPQFGYRFPDYHDHPTYRLLPHTYAWEYWEQMGQETYPQGIFKEVDVMTMLETNKPVYFQHNLRAILALARHYGDAVLMCTVTGGPAFTVERNPAARGWEFGLQEMNEVTRRVGAEMDVPVFDLAAALPKDDSFWSDPMHNNGKGSRARAALIAAYIDETGMIPPQFKTLPAQPTATN